MCGKAFRCLVQESYCHFGWFPTVYWVLCRALAAETQVIFPGFERIVHNRTYRGAVHHIPHPGTQGAGAAHQVGVALADVGAGFVDAAEVAIQENAAGAFGPLQDAGAVFRVERGVVAEELVGLDAQVAGQAVDVAVGDAGGGDTAAVGAGGAIHLILDALGDAAEDAVAVVVVVVRLHVGAEAAVFVGLLLSEQLDLDEVGDHLAGSSSPRASTGWVMVTGRGAMAATRSGRS